ncbi:glycosyltransferase [Candidatus Pelagibacter sp.]|jgi:glycosyltransferase involved in cell wall biosynthesis|nr:glycosyltransferase [Candidatus Pelagibacter sp.]
MYKKKNVFYIADFSLPNKSAYALHVLKICDAFNEINKDKINLLIPHIQKNYSNKKVKNDFLLKKIPNIKTFYNIKKKLNFFSRILYSFKILKHVRKKNYSMIISRSIIPSLILAIFNIKNTLEIHSEMTSITHIFFNIIKLNRVKRNLKFIFINEYLRKRFNITKKKSIILYDAVDHRDFHPSNRKNLKNCCFYSGSFAKGKGLEIIMKVAKRLPNINFHLYGNQETIYIKKIKKLKNVFFKGYIEYSKLVKIINNYKVLLMPYKKNVGVLIKNINVARYFSPLKMFDYLASGKIIIASDLPVYRDVLTNKVNSIIINDDANQWSKMISQTLSSNKYNYLGKIARNNSKKYSWNNRIIKIINFQGE